MVPERILNVADQANQADGAHMEAPVLGCIPGAKAGRLIMMAGGSEALFDRACSI